MTDGTFRTWEMVALGLGGFIMILYMFITDMGGEVTSLKPVLWSMLIAATGLFARPVWLLGNWREIRTWERTTAFVRKKWSTGWGKATKHYIYIEFFSKDGKIYHKDIEGYFSRNFKVGDQNDIMFAKEYMDALIFVPQAFRQAVISAAAGVLLVGGAVTGLILL